MPKPEKNMQTLRVFKKEGFCSFKLKVLLLHQKSEEEN